MQDAFAYLFTSIWVRHKSYQNIKNHVPKATITALQAAVLNYCSGKIRGFTIVFQNLKELPLIQLQVIRHASVQQGNAGSSY